MKQIKPTMVMIFIEGFKKKYGVEMVYFFTNGGCKIFSDILVKNFQGEQLHTDGHYITKVNGRYWDITGEVFIERDKIDISEMCKEGEAKMESYSNIVELVFFDIFKDVTS